MLYLCTHKITYMKRFLPHLIAFLVVAIWGVTFVCTKLLLLGGLTAAQIFILRFIIAYLLLSAYSISKGLRWMSLNWRDELIMIALGVFGGSLYFLTENSSMNYTTTTNTSIIVSLCPLFASAIIGTVLILYGMYLVNSKRPKLSA